MSKDIQGNSVASAAAFHRELAKIGDQVMRCESIVERLDGEGIWVYAINIRFPDDDHAEYLAIVKANTEKGKQVAFHGASTLAETVRGTLARLQNGTLKFREDSYG